MMDDNDIWRDKRNGIFTNGLSILEGNDWVDPWNVFRDIDTAPRRPVTMKTMPKAQRRKATAKKKQAKRQRRANRK